MSDNRQKYSDSYNPVVDLPKKRTGGSASAEMGETIANYDETKKKAPKGHRVKTTRSRSKSAAANKKPAGTGTAKSVNSAPEANSSLKEIFNPQTMRWIGGIVLCGFGIYLLVAFISYFSNCISDQAAIINSGVGSLPAVGNKAGEGGARLSEFLINGSFGVGSFVIIIWLFAIGLKMLSGWPRFKSVNFTIKCLIALITVSLIVGLLTIAWDTPVNWGGYHGRYVNEFIIGFTGWIGGAILCMILVATFFIICLRDFVNWIIRKKNEIAAKRREALRIKQEQEDLERELSEMRMREEIDAIKAGESEAKENETEDKENTLSFEGNDVEIDASLQGYDLEDEAETSLNTHGIAGQHLYDLDEAERIRDNANSGGEHDGLPKADNSFNKSDEASDSEDQNVNMNALSTESAGSAETSSGDTNETLSGQARTDEVAHESGINVSGKDSTSHASEGGAQPNTTNEGTGPMVVNVNHIAKADEQKKDGSLKHLYRFPGSDLLREGEHKVTVDIEEQQANKERIRETLLYHKIPITNIEATVGPTVTLYEIRPEQGVKIAKIKNLADDIALSLAAKGVRVIAPIPGKGTVGIEVANAEPQTVSMRTIIESRKYSETRYRLPVALGSTIGNDVYIADLTKMPHLLVAGATGQGKSVGLNAIIASLLYKKRPDELKFVMIDPKEVEFSLYAKIESHYLAKLEDSDAIVTDMSKVVPTLQSLCLEMDNRYKLLRTAEVRNIEEYNAKINRNQLNPSDGHRFLPYIVLIVDEFADLIMTSGKEVETPIARLAQKARAIGIHVIIATQRPSTNVITGIIKANFPVRMAFRVSSGVDSKTILDTTGAQQLIGKGDMLISNNSEMVRVQCAFIDTPEVEQICEYIGRQPFNSGAYILPDPLLTESGDGGGGQYGSADSLDPLFAEVAEIVVTSGVGSTSGIQRRLSIGYNRAGKIMDQLESYNVVGPSMGGKPRQVLMDAYGLTELLKTLSLK